MRVSETVSHRRCSSTREAAEFSPLESTARSYSIRFLPENATSHDYLIAINEHFSLFHTWSVEPLSAVCAGFMDTWYVLAQRVQCMETSVSNFCEYITFLLSFSLFEHVICFVLDILMRRGL